MEIEQYGPEQLMNQKKLQRKLENILRQQNKSTTHKNVWNITKSVLIE